MCVYHTRSAWSYPNFKGSCSSSVSHSIYARFQLQTPNVLQVDLSKTTCLPKRPLPASVIADAAAACAAAVAAAKDVQTIASSFGTVVQHPFEPQTPIDFFYNFDVCLFVLRST